MSPRSSNAVSSSSTGSRGVAVERLVGYLKPATVGGVVSAPVRQQMLHRTALTSSLRAASVTCSMPKPNVTASRVVMIAPPLAVCAGDVA